MGDAPREARPPASSGVKLEDETPAIMMETIAKKVPAPKTAKVNKTIRKKTKRAPARRAKPRASRLLGATAALALLAAMGALGLSAMALWPQNPVLRQMGEFLPGGAIRARVEAGEQRVQLTRRVGEIEQRINELPASQDELRGELATATTRLRESQQNLRSRLEILREDSQRAQDIGEIERADTAREMRAQQTALAALRAQIARGADHFRLAEVEHLLLLAQQQLRFAFDAELAARALALAAQRLAEIPSAEFEPARIAIAKDMAALAELSVGDADAVLNELSELAREVNELPLPDPAAPRIAPPPPADEVWWRALGREMLADLSDLVQVDTDGAPPPLTPELRRLTKLRAQLLIESAAQALLRGRFNVYALSLQDAHDFIAMHFDADAFKTRGFLAEIANIKSRAPSPPPDLEASLQLLRDAMRAQ